MLDPSIPDNLREVVSRELDRDERVVWAAMPRPVFFTPMSTGAFLFGIPWTAFAFFWVGMAGMGVWGQGGIGLFSLFPLFGVPFILVGFGMLSAPIFAYRKSKKTIYVITERRVITFEGGRSTTIRSYPPEKLTDVFRRERKDGYGDIIIARREWHDNNNRQQMEELGLLRIADAKQVEDLVKALAQQAVPTQ